MHSIHREVKVSRRDTKNSPGGPQESEGVNFYYEKMRKEKTAQLHVDRLWEHSRGKVGEETNKKASALMLKPKSETGRERDGGDGQVEFSVSADPVQ